jgi:hypothetical protein
MVKNILFHRVKMPEIIETEKLDNREFAKQLEERTKRFTASIIRLSASPPKTPEAKVICYQIENRAHEIFGPVFNEKLFREQLSYFEDIDYSEQVEFIKNTPLIKDVQAFLTEVALAEFLKTWISEFRVLSV